MEFEQHEQVTGMRRLIAEVRIMPWGAYKPVFYCVDSRGEIDEAVSSTLLDLIEAASTNYDELSALIETAETGLYISPNLALPDWGVDGIHMWLTEPIAKPGCLCITNENSSFSMDSYPQQFTFRQFKLALSHWRNFVGFKNSQRKSTLVGYRAIAAFE